MNGLGFGAKSGLPEVARLIVVGPAKTDSRHDGEPPEIGVRIEKLMEGIDPQACRNPGSLNRSAKLRCRLAMPVSPS